MRVKKGGDCPKDNGAAVHRRGAGCTAWPIGSTQRRPRPETIDLQTGPVLTCWGEYVFENSIFDAESGATR
jgi:hypothetical protein